MNGPEPEVHPSVMDAKRRKLLLRLAASTVLPLFVGCATPVAGTWLGADGLLDEPGFLPPPEGQQHRVALVLSGGGARGFAHLGVLRVLERQGWRPDLVVGTSAGAIVGALYASGLSAAAIETAAATLDWSMLFDFDPFRSLLGGVGLGMVRGKRLEKFLRQQIPLPIERFATPFAAVAADMEKGEVVALNRGDAARAVLASSAVPGLYAPVRVRGQLLADGQVVSPLPVPTARSLGALRVIAVDVIYPPQHSEMSNPLSMLFQSMIVSGWRHAIAARALADLVIFPDVHTPSQLGLASRAWLIEAGERAAGAQLQELRALFEQA